MTPKSFGRYETISELGHGGMAIVYLALDPRFGRQVALKVMSFAHRDDPTFRGRFEREARTIATLEHPAIVPVYDVGEDHDQLYLVMRYMPGGSLADRIHRGPLGLDEAVAIVNRIGSALDHAHRRGVIHRDLKPANVLFDQYGNPFLSDFGIVKLMEATSGVTGSGVIGTPAYMSPEQIHGDMVIDGRSDIYTLGIILFEMLTGRKPYRADTPAKLMMAHLLNPVPSVLELRPELPPAYDSVIQKALSKEPDVRFATAEDLVTALTTSISGQRVSSLPVSAPGLPSPAMPAAVAPADDEPTETVEDPALEAEAAGSPASFVPAAGSGAAASRYWLWGIILLAVLGGVFLMWWNDGLNSGRANTLATPTAEDVMVVVADSPTATATTAASATATATAEPTATLTITATPPPALPTPEITPTALWTPEALEIGRTALDTPITAVRFGRGAQAIFFIGGIHAGFAPGSVELAQEAIDYFSQNAQEVPETVSLYIIINANPDSEPRPGDLRGRVNSNGVDLNRNWDCFWQEDAVWRTETVAGLGGEGPFSEPETRSLSNFILRQETAAVVFWQARALDGLVSPGNCGLRSRVSEPVAEAYAGASGYNLDSFERLVGQQLTGDATNWLDQRGTPAISVLLPDYEAVDFENNLAGMLAVLQAFATEPQ